MPLTAKEFIEHIERLGLSLDDAARILGVADETTRALASDEEFVPAAASVALVLMVEFQVDPWRFGYTNPGD